MLFDLLFDRAIGVKSRCGYTEKSTTFANERGILVSNDNRFKPSFLTEPGKVIHDAFELMGNLTLQTVGDLIRGTSTSADSLENPSIPDGIDPNREGGTPRSHAEQASIDLKELAKQRSDELREHHARQAERSLVRERQRSR